MSMNTTVGESCFELFCPFSPWWKKNLRLSSVQLSFSTEASSGCHNTQQFTRCCCLNEQPVVSYPRQKAGRSVSPLREHTSNVKVITVVGITCFLAALTHRGDTITEALWLTVAAEGSLPVWPLIIAEHRGWTAVSGTIPRFSGSQRNATRGITCLDAQGEMSRLDTEGHLIVPPPGVSCPLLCAFLMKGARLWPVAMSSRVFPRRIGLDMTLWQKMSTKLNQRLQVYRQLTSLWPIAPFIGQTKAPSDCERSGVITHSNVNVGGIHYVSLW